jgi:hypothetical protein
MCLLLVIAAVVSVPLMTDYVLLGESTAASLAHIENIYRNIGKVFPVRLGAMGMSPYGYSMAAFQADIFYRIPVLLRLIGVSLGNAFKFTILLFNIITPFAAFECFKTIFSDKRTGLVASMMYTWCPYRITSLYISGNLSEVFAWTILPLVFLGLWQLYEECNKESGSGRAWITLTWGFSLLVMSSTVFFFLAVCMTLCIILVIVSDRKKKHIRNIMIQLFKTGLCTVMVSAWFLIPMLLRMREASAVGAMIPQNVQNMGMYIVQYFRIINFAGGSSEFWDNGLQKAVAYEPGAAVSILSVVFLWLLFIGRNSRKNKYRSAIVITGIISVLLSLNVFLWDMFQNKNMLFSIVLAFMENPARWGIVADVCMIMTACYTLLMLKDLYGEKVQLWCMLAAAAVSFVTTQFLTGNILSKVSFVKEEEITAFGSIEMPVIYGESVVWRLCEAVSVVSVCVLIAIWLIKKAKNKNSRKQNQVG